MDGITDSMNMNLGELGDSEGWGGQVPCSPRGRQESDMTRRLNNDNIYG